MNTVTFSGYYGMKNYGDDLFGVVSCIGADKWWGSHHVRILGPRIPGEKGDFTVPSWLSIDRYGASSAAGKSLRMLLTTREIIRANRFIYSGGSLFSSNRSRMMKIAEWLAPVKRHGFAAIGVSVGPFSSVKSEREVLNFLNRFSFISVRDNRSYELMSSSDFGGRLTRGRDLAGLAATFFPLSPKAFSDKRVLAYCPCNIPDEPGLSAQMDDLFVRAVKEIDGIRVKLIALNGHVDHGDQARVDEVHRRLAAMNMESEKIYYWKVGVREIWSEIGRCDAVVSVRLHGAITAYLTGVPFILFEYHQKCTSFLNDVGQIGSLRIHNVGDEDPKSLRDRIYSAVSGNVGTPSLARGRYAEEAASHFTDAPWCAT